MAKLPYAARRRLEHTKYGPAASVSVALGATEHDVSIYQGVGGDTSVKTNVVPIVTLHWLTTFGVEFLPGQTDFSTGFRVIFGAPAPASATLDYAMRVLE